MTITTGLFNTIPNRRASESEKWNDYAGSVIPMWVADSDYGVPQCVLDAIKSRLEHPVLGYGQESEKLRQLITNRLEKLYGWSINSEWICFTPGVVGSLNSCRAIMGGIGSNAVTAIPVYPHLRNASPVLERGMRFFNMINIDGRYTPDFEELESVIDENTKMLILCNPHNPVGTVYNDEELQKFAYIAEKYDLLICSDDIHADFVLDPNKKYHPIASLSPEVSNRTMILMAASKTFNIAGLNCSYAIIENEELRNAFKTQLKGLVGGVNILGFIASEAAYEYGEEWLVKQVEHIRSNAEYCYKRITDMPLLSMNKLEATYLAWLDATELNKKVKSKGYNNAYEYLLKCGVAVSDGTAFGDPSFIRINLATSMDILKKGLDAIECGIQEL